MSSNNAEWPCDSLIEHVHGVRLAKRKRIGLRLITTYLDQRIGSLASSEKRENGEGWDFGEPFLSLRACLEDMECHDACWEWLMEHIVEIRQGDSSSQMEFIVAFAADIFEGPVEWNDAGQAVLAAKMLSLGKYPDLVWLIVNSFTHFPIEHFDRFETEQRLFCQQSIALGHFLLPEGQLADIRRDICYWKSP